MYIVYGIYVLRTFLIIDATTPNQEITYCLENKNYIIYIIYYIHACSIIHL